MRKSERDNIHPCATNTTGGKEKYMRAVDTYKKCMRCGDNYRIESQLTKCMCGGHLYVAGLIYQEKTRGVVLNVSKD